MHAHGRITAALCRQPPEPRVRVSAWIYLFISTLYNGAALETRTWTRRAGAPEPSKSRFWQCKRVLRACGGVSLSLPLLRPVGTLWYCLHCVTVCALNKTDVVSFFFFVHFLRALIVSGLIWRTGIALLCNLLFVPLTRFGASAVLTAAVSRPGDLFTLGFGLRSELLACGVSPWCPLGKLTRKLGQTEWTRCAFFCGDLIITDIEAL